MGDDDDYDYDGDAPAAAAEPARDYTAISVVKAAEGAAEAAAPSNEAPEIPLPEIAPGILQFSAIFAPPVPKPARQSAPARRLLSRGGKVGAGGAELEQSDASKMAQAA